MALILSVSAPTQPNSLPPALDLAPYIEARNQEVRLWLAARGREIYQIPEARAAEIAEALESFRARDPALFFGVFLPTLSVESGFSNLCFDGHLRPSRRSCGYGGLQVRTARDIGKRLGYDVPQDWPQTQDWIIQDWRAALEISWEFLRILRCETGGDLEAMSAYRTGLQGWRDGKRAVTRTMEKARERSLAMWQDEEREKEKR